MKHMKTLWKVILGIVVFVIGFVCASILGCNDPRVEGFNPFGSIAVAFKRLPGSIRDLWNNI